jgi:hypothetical protein
MVWLAGQYNQPPRMAAALSHFLYSSLCCLPGGFLLFRVPTHFLESRLSSVVLIWLVCPGAGEMPVRFSNNRWPIQLAKGCTMKKIPSRRR